MTVLKESRKGVESNNVSGAHKHGECKIRGTWTPGFKNHGQLCTFLEAFCLSQCVHLNTRE